MKIKNGYVIFLKIHKIHEHFKVKNFAVHLNFQCTRSPRGSEKKGIVGPWCPEKNIDFCAADALKPPATTD